jgi:hypothetical protein
MIKKAEYFNLLSTTTPTVTTDTVMPALVAIPTPSSQRKLRRDFYSNEWLAYPEILRPVTLKGFMARLPRPSCDDDMHVGGFAGASRP